MLIPPAMVADFYKLTMTIADWSEFYAGDLGYPVFPVYGVRNGICTCRKRAKCRTPGKHPRNRNGVTGATAEIDVVRRWWADQPSSNVGLATGARSGLVALDVDPRHNGDDDLKRAQKRLGELPEGPVAQTGGGGWHLFFEHPGRVRGKLPGTTGIDVKGDGGYVVVPASIHVSGNAYSWLELLEGEVPSLPESWLEALVITPCYTEGARTYFGGTGGGTGEGCVAEQVEEAIAATLPRDFGQRHRQIFEFARWLKAIPAIADASTTALVEYAREWHRRSLPAIRTKAWEETLADFLEGWDKVQYPRGRGPMTDLVKRAAAGELPAVAEQFEQPELRLLVAVCRELQAVAGDGAFHLSSRAAGESVGVSHQHALRWLRLLVRLGILERVSQGDYRKRRASEYRYLGG